MSRQITGFLNTIKFEHTIFALPFGYLSMVLAAGGRPSWRQFIWITVAMAAARTAAIAANRLIDHQIDARNPRTANRSLPQGLISPAIVTLVIIISTAVLLIAARQLNPLALVLSPFALFLLIGCSFTKRFTWLSHFILGLADGMAPAGAWVAVRGRLDPQALLLWFATAVWIAGFDLLYACRDVEFDRAEGLCAAPARFGISTALRQAQICHALTILSLAVLGLWLGLGAIYWLGWLVVVALLFYERSLARPDAPSKVTLILFTVKSPISIVTLFATLPAPLVPR